MSSTGLYLGTAGWLLVFGQLGIGLALDGMRGQERVRWRKLHFGTMLGIAALVLSHIGFMVF